MQGWLQLFNMDTSWWRMQAYTFMQGKPKREDMKREPKRRENMIGRHLWLSSTLKTTWNDFVIFQIESKTKYEEGKGRDLSVFVGVAEEAPYLRMCSFRGETTNFKPHW